MKTTFRVLLLFSVVAVLTVGCTQRRNLSENTLMVHLLAEPQNLHPTNNNSNYQRLVLSFLHRRLMVTDLRTQLPVPELLTQNPVLNPDSLGHVLHLRKDAFWDNGKAISINDLIFTFKIQACLLTGNPDVKIYFDNVLNIERLANDSLALQVINKRKHFDYTNFYTIFYVLPEYFFDPQQVLSKYDFKDLTNKSFMDQAPAELIGFFEAFNNPDKGRNLADMVGAGPYKLQNWDSGKSITLIKKQNWWGNRDTSVYQTSYPEKIIFRIEREMESVILNFKKQNYDVSFDLSTNALVKLQKRDYFNENYESAFIPTFSYTYMGLNMKPDASKIPFFSDVLVRKAIALATPTDEVIAIIAKSKAIKIPSFITPMQADYDTSLAILEYNLTQAAALLDQAGWVDKNKDGVREKVINGVSRDFRFELIYPQSPVTKEVGLILKNSYKKIGVALEGRTLDFGLYIKQLSTHDFDACLGSWSSSAAPENPAQIWHSSSWANQGSNFVGFGTAESDSLIDLANQTMDLGKRKVLMQKIQRLIYKEQPYVFLFAATKKVAVHKRFDHRGIYAEKNHVILNNLKLNPAFSSPSIDLP